MTLSLLERGCGPERDASESSFRIFWHNKRAFFGAKNYGGENKKQRLNLIGESLSHVISAFLFGKVYYLKRASEPFTA